MCDEHLPLFPSEERLLRELNVKLGEKLPEPDERGSILRGAFLVDFLQSVDRDGYACAIEGARILGSLSLQRRPLKFPLVISNSQICGDVDFSWCQVAGEVVFSGCHFEGNCDFRGTQIQGHLTFIDCIIDGGIDLDHSRIEGDLQLKNSKVLAVECSVSANEAHIGGSAHLCSGFEASGLVSFNQSSIGKSLCMHHSVIRATSERACFSLQMSRVAGNVNFGPKFEASGGITIINSTLGSDLSFKDAAIEAECIAFMCQACVISGTAYLLDCRSRGVFGFVGTRLEQSLIVKDAEFNGAGDDVFENLALTVEECKIELKFHILRTEVRGTLNLSDAALGSLEDDASSWPDSGSLVLDGCTYKSLRIGGEGESVHPDRIRWLLLQDKRHLGAEFRNQPWEQLATVLKKQGAIEEARQVAIAKQDALRRASKVRGRAAHWAYGKFAGYGYRPLRILSIAFFIWVASSAAFWGGHEIGVVLPRKSDDAAAAGKCHGSPASPGCDLTLSVARPFNGFVYSLDLMLPVVNLQQREDWAPAEIGAGWQRLVASVLRAFMWFDILSGWVSTLVLAAIMSGLARKD